MRAIKGSWVNKSQIVITYKINLSNFLRCLNSPCESSLVKQLNLKTNASRLCKPKNVSIWMMVSLFLKINKCFNFWRSSKTWLSRLVSSLLFNFKKERFIRPPKTPGSKDVIEQDLFNFNWHNDNFLMFAMTSSTRIRCTGEMIVWDSDLTSSFKKWRFNSVFVKTELPEL